MLTQVHNLRPLARPPRQPHSPAARLAQLASWTAAVAILALAARAVADGEPAEPDSRLTLDRIFAKGEFKTESWGPAQWLKGGADYTVLEESEETKGGKDIVRYSLPGDERCIVVPAARLIPAGQEKPLQVNSYAWSADGRRVLLFTNSKRVWRQNTRGDYWVLDVNGGPVRQLGGPADPARLMFATFSPDGGRVAYVYRNNLYVQNVQSLAITRLTRDGSDTVINGTADWVYEEEFGLRHGFRWSPDGKFIAYWQFDTAGVPEYRLLNTTDALYPTVTAFAYPKVGQTNPACRIGIVKAAGGRTRWIETGADPRNHYIPEMEWQPDSKAVVFQQLNRQQSTNRLWRAPVRRGEIEVLHLDRDDAWVDPMTDWHWLDDGRWFLWLSEKNGWRHLYKVSRVDGREILLTPGEFDAIQIAGVDAARGWVYFIASPENPTQRYLFRTALAGAGAAERVTPAGQPGTHSYSLSPDAQWAIHTHSRFGQPPVVARVRLPGHERDELLADNSEMRAKLDRLEPCATEFLRVNIGEDVALDGWCLLPPGFDATRQYPLLLHVYGEPAGQTVLDRWGGETWLWHRLLAQHGCVVMSFDNRGTAAPRGRDWRKCIYRQVGILASADQAAATRAVLAARPYLDPGRVGIWGWSGGGSMALNAIFRHPDLYQAAIAIAFISNQEFYDTIYQERYMDLLPNNADGYRQGSPLTFAHQLQGNLLLVYGTGDDNTHHQNLEVLVNELVRHKKPFSMMSYPSRTHGLHEGENTRLHLFTLLTRFLREHLPLPPSNSPN